MQSWADGEWFKKTARLWPTRRVFKVTGEPTPTIRPWRLDAWSRPDILLHALAMLKWFREGISRTSKA
jgi:aconitase B